MMEIKFKKLSDKAVIPTKAHPTDAGFDMTAAEIKITEDYVSYKTNIALEIPEGYVGLLFPRSSNSKKDLLLANSIGVVDSHYRGDVEFRFKRIMMPVMQQVRIAPPTGDPIQDAANIREVPALAYRDDYIYKVGDRVGQLVVIPYPEINLVETDELSETDRGSSGFGMSGN